MKKSLNGAILTVWFGASLYLGMGGYSTIVLDKMKYTLELSPPDSILISKDGVPKVFGSFREYEYVRVKDEMESIFPFVENLISEIGLLVTSMCFGVIGGVTRILKQITYEEDISIINAQVISIPVLGMLSGIIMLGLTYLIPTILVEGVQNIRPSTLVFLSLFAGLFSKRFYDWLSNSFNKIFPSN
ncbi:MAG: hypothetical protein RIC80_04915 [Cyclobacteriaceae bacterium]